jgi:hypothetical protein
VSIPADVRIGEKFFKLAGDAFFDETGVRPMERDWRSLFAGRQNVSGPPGVQNVRDEDLRWLQDSFAGGEGQDIVRLNEPTELRRYDRSNGIDLALPGQLRLAREVFQYGKTGGSEATHEGNSFSNDVGNSTVVGTDRRLNVLNDVVAKDIALTAGIYQIDWYGYIDPPSVDLILGSDLNVMNGSGQVVGTSMWLKDEGTKVGTGPQSPQAGLNLEVEFTVHVTANSTEHVKAIATVFIVNVTNDVIVASTQIQLGADAGETTTKKPKLSYTAKGGKDYRYRVKLEVRDGKGCRFYVDQILPNVLDRQAIYWEILDGATVLASETRAMRGVTATRIIGSTVITLLSDKTIRFRFRYAEGSLKPYLDKLVASTVGMSSPAALELGAGDKIWFVDDENEIFYWDPLNSKWSGKAHAASWPITNPKSMAHTQEMQFCAGTRHVIRFGLNQDGQVWVTNAGWTSIWCAVGGNRLFVLDESSATGSTLYEAPLTGTAPQTATSKYVPGNAGIIPDASITQKVAGVKNGCIFFANNGPDCWLYEWDGTNGVPLTNLPTGFKARSLIHGGGRTWVGGGFPATDSLGNTTIRPAIFVVDGTNSSPDVTSQQLDVKLYRDDDPTTHIQSMQLYGADLWVLTEVGTTPAKMRLWRVSLRGDEFAPFLEHEISTTPGDQQSGKARGLAVTWKDRFAAWTKGGPYQVSANYVASDTPFLRTSRTNYGLLERKLLLALDLEADIPEGTWVELWYSLDGADFVGAGRWEESGRRVVSMPGGSAFFHHLALECRLRTTSSALSPYVFAFGALAYLPEYDKAWDLMVACLDENAVWRKDGTSEPGWAGISYLYALAEAGEVVEFEDLFATKRPEDSLLYQVVVESPRAQFLRRGEALVRVRLAERGLIPR